MNSIFGYFEMLAQVGADAVASDMTGRTVHLNNAIKWGVEIAKGCHAAGNKIMFIGNGGSAGIASHMAIDYSKNGGLRAMAFNDGAALTCLGNDLGYAQVFAKQIDLHARAGDFLVSISSSGRSANILGAVEVARGRGCTILTLSGFTADNPLRAMGDMNLFVDSDQYGMVEITHLALCHAIVDFSLGWESPGAAHELGRKMNVL